VITRFADWCAQRGIECVSGVTPDIVAAYRRKQINLGIRQRTLPFSSTGSAICS
jgi:hypothetical protein